ncbi:MCP four helix bundle domain-containing protein [Duganella sp. LX20W]|uniref:MCP four helix bundle domain-containing protein n=1 Tax=Rugamonas brunnea TaxID=2758569 RepID=A0A7W2EVY5_9BURK|nr:methyl-accepting chemotaxis protein [Rugamonas brunnea]MBA5639606.1 MCP four helix bundle domain-containing protein [Rugamonas brunnea]
MLKQLRIGPKLLLAPGLVLVLLMCTSGAGYYGMVRQNASLENLVQVRAARLKAAADVGGEAKHAHANIYQLLAWTNGSFAQDRIDALARELRGRHAAIADQLAALARVADPAERPFVDASAEALAAYRKAVRETMEIAQVDQSIAANSMAKAEQQFSRLNGALAKLAALEQQLSVQAHGRAKAEFHTLGLTMAGLLALSVALSLVVTMRVRGAMLRDIQAIAAVVVKLAAGKLAPGRGNDGHDEIAHTARLLDGTMEQLSATLRTILAAVQNIDLAAHDIASGNLDLSNRTERQAGSLEQTASAMDSLTVAVRDNAAHAQQACQLADGASQLAERGGAAMGEAVETMESIRAGASQIVDITGVIDAIALQTNILALNAAVEAARAGEQGRGFAIVAAEVRTLAQRSAAAASQIKGLVAASVATIDTGGASVRQAGERMGELAASVRQVNDIIRRISSASADQAQGIAEVNQAMVQMDEMTQQNAALVEQAAAAAASLQEQTENLTQAVAVFQLDDDAAESVPAATPAAILPPRPQPLRPTPASMTNGYQNRPPQVRRA